MRKVTVHRPNQTCLLTVWDCPDDFPPASDQDWATFIERWGLGGVFADRIRMYPTHFEG